MASRMSATAGHRLVTAFLRVKQRLESLLEFCRLHEHIPPVNNDEWEDRDRFRGPYRWDIEELETSISTVTTLIANLQHECDANDDRNPIPDYPLCVNAWTMEQIDRLDTEREKQINLDTLAVLRLQTLNECMHKLNSHSSRSHHEHHTTVSWSIPPAADSTFDLLALPAEILLHIFSYISPCELVSNVAPTCRCFAELILTRLYSHLDLSNMISVFDVPRLLEHLPCLRSLTLIDWENDVSILSWAIWFDVLTRDASRIHTLYFRNVLLSPILISLVMEYFPHCLQSIVFDCQQHKTYERFDLILCLMADPTAQIQHVTASYQQGITNFGIAHLASRLVTLKELNLIYIEATDDETMELICDKHQPHLEVLRVDGAQLTDRALDAIGQCSQLQAILIEFCTNLTGLNFSIFQNFAFLRELCLSKLTSIPPECFQLIFNEEHRFSHLTTLKLGECHLLDDRCIQSIVQTCPRLIHFTCSWAYAVTDVGFTDIVSRCEHLEELSLMGCYQIFGDLLNDVPDRYLRSIRSINLEQCNHIQDDLLLDLYRRKRTITIVNYYGSAVNDDDEE